MPPPLKVDYFHDWKAPVNVTQVTVFLWVYGTTSCQ